MSRYVANFDRSKYYLTRKLLAVERDLKGVTRTERRIQRAVYDPMSSVPIPRIEATSWGSVRVAHGVEL